MTAATKRGAERSMRAHLAQTLATAVQESTAAGYVGESAAAVADALLLDAIRERATDIHFEPRGSGVMVRLRIDGRLHDAMLMSSDEGAHIVRHFKAIGGLDSSQHFVPCNTRVTREVEGRPIDLRLSTMPSVRGEALTVRVLDRMQVNEQLEDLGLSRVQHRRIGRWLANAYGMFLAAGPSGSGKTTTLYALLHELRNHERATFTIEDPIEYEIDGITQTQVNRHHNLSFAEGLRAMLRLDSDYLMLGEIRDPETARAAIEASACGRILLSTTHSPDAVGVVTTLRNLGLSDLEIASSLHLVVAQRLVRRLCPNCCQRVEVESQSRSSGPALRQRRVWTARGCDQCHELGYAGRTGLFEIWKLTDDDRGLILGHADEQAIRRQLAAQDFRTLAADGYLKACQGVTSIAEVRQALASYPTRSHQSERSGHELLDSDRGRLRGARLRDNGGRSAAAAGKSVGEPPRQGAHPGAGD